MDCPNSCRVRWGVSIQETTFSVEPVVFTVLELVHKEQTYGKSIGRSYVNEWTSPSVSFYSNSRDVPNSSKAPQKSKLQDAKYGVKNDTLFIQGVESAYIVGLTFFTVYFSAKCELENATQVCTSLWETHTHKYIHSTHEPCNNIATVFYM